MSSWPTPGCCASLTTWSCSASYKAAMRYGTWGLPGGPSLSPERPEQTGGLKVADVGDPCPSYTPPNTASPLEGFRKDAGEAVLLCPEKSGSEGPPPLQKGKVVLIVLGVFMREYLGMQP